MLLEPLMQHFPLDTDPKKPAEPLRSPDVIASMQPATDDPKYGLIGHDSIMAMYILGVGYVVMRTHETDEGDDAGVSIFTEREVNVGP